MSLLIGNTETAASFYPVGKKAGQVSKSSEGKLLSSLFLFLHRNHTGSCGKNSTGFFKEGKKRNSILVVFVMILWKDTHISVSEGTTISEHFQTHF